MTTESYSNDVDRRYPPIAWLTTGALVAIIIGGILIAAYAPRKAPLGVAVAMLVIGAALLATGWLLLSRQKVFSWTTFRNVLKWALLAYFIQSGMIEFAFIRNHARGATLMTVTLMLVVFALAVPSTIAFTVARYATPD
ncbi:MAG TPA: hypothetical protein VGS61_02825 [Acidimicrobiales bacterium]|nr:hypothetical protein [Acidimicrobiales bacterium]